MTLQKQLDLESKMLLDKHVHQSLRMMLPPNLSLDKTTTTVPLVLADVASMSLHVPIILSDHPFAMLTACLGQRPYPAGSDAPLLIRCLPLRAAPIDASYSINDEAKYVQIRPRWGAL